VNLNGIALSGQIVQMKLSQELAQMQMIAIIKLLNRQKRKLVA
jgi:hypothetical protein